MIRSSPVCRSSYTSTDPTIGFGAVWPAPSEASSKQRCIYVSGEIKSAKLTQTDLFLRMDLQQAQRQLTTQLTPLYGGREASIIADWVMQHLTGRKKLDRLLFFSPHPPR